MRDMRAESDVQPDVDGIARRRQGQAVQGRSRHRAGGEHRGGRARNAPPRLTGVPGHVRQGEGTRLGPG